jgi:hypothetical protein
MLKHHTSVGCGVRFVPALLASSSVLVAWVILLNAVLVVAFPALDGSATNGRTSGGSGISPMVACVCILLGIVVPGAVFAHAVVRRLRAAEGPGVFVPAVATLLGLLTVLPVVVGQVIGADHAARGQGLGGEADVASAVARSAAVPSSR